MEMKGRGIKRNIGGTQSDRESIQRKKEEVSHSEGETQTGLQDAWLWPPVCVYSSAVFQQELRILHVSLAWIEVSPLS